MHISPSNVSEITLALFYVTQQEVRQKYTATALDLMDTLTQAWYQCSQSDNGSNTQLKLLINAARKIIPILKPTVKQRIESQIACLQ